ncbi:hypothetical protein B0H13DRAFT_1882517 [Mycena leptocephala]|nr:hypothetical protein B0H13DRAFT_1882517 [Mycena leptocephala]
MLWEFSARKTHSGAVFAVWTGKFDFAPLLSRAVAMESDQQEDSEPDDAPIDPLEDPLNQIDTEWPPDPLNQVDEQWPPPDPMNEVDDLLEPPPPPKKRKCLPTTYDDCLMM